MSSTGLQKENPTDTDYRTEFAPCNKTSHRVRDSTPEAAPAVALEKQDTQASPQTEVEIQADEANTNSEERNPEQEEDFNRANQGPDFQV